MSITILSDLQNIMDKYRHGVVAIGNFDGVHIAHQKLLYDAVQLAQQYNTFPSVLTFTPHPKDFFSKSSQHFLTTFEDKIELFASMGIKVVYNVTFDEALAKMSAAEFCKLLFTQLKVRHILCGYNFHFGHGRKGDANFLRDSASIYSANCSVNDRIMAKGKLVSSSNIKLLLQQGCTCRAAELLGRPHSMQGVLLQGYNNEYCSKDELYHTAINIKYSYAPILPGNYCVKVILGGGHILGGVAEIKGHVYDMKNYNLIFHTTERVAATANANCSVQVYDLLHPAQFNLSESERQWQLENDIKGAAYLKNFTE